MNKSLRDLSVIYYGKSPNEVRVDESDFPVYGTGGIFGYAAKPLYDGPLVVVARKGTLDSPSYASGPCWVTDTTYAVLAKKNVNTKWLFYQLSNFDLTLLNEATGVPSISRDYLYRISFPDTPPNEQRKIARILTTLDNLIEKTEALIAKYQAIKQGMMHDLFTRGVDSSGQLRPTYEQAPHLYKQSELGWIPKEWEQGWLYDEIGPITSGWSPLCDSVPATKDQWAIQKTTVCVWSGYDETENKRLPDHFQPKPHLEVQADDILVTRKGPFDRVGVVVHVHETRPKLMFPDTVFRLRIKNESDVLPAFLPFALGSVAVQSDWYGRKIGLADAQVNINHGILKTTYFPKPKPDEQQMIVARLLQIQSQIRVEEKQLNKLSSVKSGLMQDLLTGKVRVQVDEAEEVADHA